MPADYAGNTIGTARELNINPTNQTFQDYVSSLDTHDYYQFSLSGSSSFNLTLNGLSANANVQLLSSSNEVLQSSTNRGRTAELISTTLDAGIYYIQVYPGTTSASTYYNLSIAANQAPQQLQFHTTKTVYEIGETVSLTNAWVYDGDSYTDLAYIDFWLQTDDSTWLDLGDVSTFTTWDNEQNWASFDYDLSDLAEGNYLLQGQVYDQSGALSNSFQRSFSISEIEQSDNTAPLANPNLPLNQNVVSINNLVFSGDEGESGTFEIRLNQEPTSDVTLSFSAGSFLTVDADGDISNGTQNTLTFTATDWNLGHTVWFIAENDGSSTNRVLDNTIGYTLSDGTTGSGIYDLGSIINTYAPDSSEFNIDLDFRNDYLGFWTPERQAIAQEAADDWANLIANELDGLILENQTLGQVGANGTSAFDFTTNRYVDDLVIFVSAYTGDSWGGWGGPSLSTTASNPLPRAGNIAANSTITWSDANLYSLVAHEIGHALGLIGLNYTSSLLVSNGYFTGSYSKAYNGGNDVPLGSSYHPGNSVNSIMSYGYIYNLSAPTEMDKRLLADSGYQVYGVNASSSASQPLLASASNYARVSDLATTSSSSIHSLRASGSSLVPRCGCTTCLMSSGINTLGSSSLSSLTDLV